MNIYKAVLAVLLMSTTFGVIYRLHLKCLKMSTLSTFGVFYRRSFKCHWRSLRPEGPSVSDNVHEVWSWSSFNRWLRRHVTSRHILRRRLVSTLWTRPHVMNIDRRRSFNVVRHDAVRLRSQCHHRKQMWCQMLINCNGNEPFWFQYQYA